MGLFGKERKTDGFKSKSALLAFDFDVVPAVPPTGIPLLGICILTTAIAVLAIWHVGGQSDTTLWRGAIVLLILAALTFIYEHFKDKRRIGKLMKQFKEPVEELYAIHKRGRDYLKSLDQRTSKYFHCVTNSKVTNYFVLRQLENNIANFLKEITPLFQNPGHNSYMRLYAALRGNLEYRDGLEMSQGNVYNTPVVELGNVVDGYIYELENALGELEEEISHLYDQV